MFWKEGNCGIGWKFQTEAFQKHFYWFLLNIHGIETFCLWLSILWVWHTAVNGFGVVFLRVQWWCFCCIWHSVYERASPDPGRLWSIAFRAVYSGLSPGCQAHARWRLLTEKHKARLTLRDYSDHLCILLVYLGFAPGRSGSPHVNRRYEHLALSVPRERHLSIF